MNTSRDAVLWVLSQYDITQDPLFTWGLQFCCFCGLSADQQLLSDTPDSPQAAAQQKEADTTQRAEREVTRMVIVMVMAFLLCWLPYSTFALVVATHKGIIIQPVLASLPSYFSKTATVYNPIIYVFMNKQVRKSLPNKNSFTGAP